MEPTGRWRSVVRAVLLGGAAVAAVLRLTRAGLLFVTVVGNSMEPTLDPGDRVIALRRRVARPLRVGDIVVLKADGRNLIKRLAATGGMEVPAEPGRTVPPGSLWLLGDGQESFDSRHFGAVADDEVIGLVVRRLWGDPRRG
ncbi:S26 family signal peptidase [Kribbella sp. CA-293567]|uniref:S26 family signal peptidase n=1 Tax=Kribbella sp. CA-293567 TaxID=3002436 RepID=UPI0022DD1118|nr:S26 family signal peptidase [Kribbella sp. CA-293567]WBQ01970.1 S26 family signal peptidase [Kribbella sp. CA-293567]